MSDWEEYCDSIGMNIGDSDAYDRWIDRLDERPDSKPWPGRPRRLEDGRLQFANFGDACFWARFNPGISFTAAPDGGYVTTGVPYPRKSPDRTDAKTMTRNQLVDQLVKLGFKCQSTASQKWKCAFFASNGSKSLFVLFRARGIDLLEAPCTHLDLTNEDGLLSISITQAGGRFGSYFYTDSEVVVHERVLEVAGLFIDKQPLADTCFAQVGISRSQWGAKRRQEEDDFLNKRLQA